MAETPYTAYSYLEGRPLWPLSKLSLRMPLIGPNPLPSLRGQHKPRIVAVHPAPLHSEVQHLKPLSTIGHRRSRVPPRRPTAAGERDGIPARQWWFRRAAAELLSIQGRGRVA